MLIIEKQCDYRRRELIWGESKICHTEMFEQKFVNAIQAISNWKVPRPDFLQIF